MPTILLTGATGYIGSHTWLALARAGFDVIGVDDFSNSSPQVLVRLQTLLGHAPRFERLNVCDTAAMQALLARHHVDATVHFAAFKAVGESTAKPLAYYANNLGGLLAVCEAMRRYGTGRFVFSSSATVYGQPETLPIEEDAPLAGGPALVIQHLDLVNKMFQHVQNAVSGPNLFPQVRGGIARQRGRHRQLPARVGPGAPRRAVPPITHAAMASSSIRSPTVVVEAPEYAVVMNPVSATVTPIRR